jgi:uncharacterized protein YjiS (DUF1127 family)
MSTSRPFIVAAPIARRGVHAARIVGCFLAWVWHCGERAAQRRNLAQMTDWQLRDIGISRLDADAEARKWPWRA